MSPRKVAGILDQLQFRQRSRSEKSGGDVVIAPKPKKVSFLGSGNASGKMATIPSVDENLHSPSRLKALDKLIRPLYVDTQLANRGGSSSSARSPRSPVGQVVDFMKQRNRHFSGNTNAINVGQSEEQNFLFPQINVSENNPA